MKVIAIVTLLLVATAQTVVSSAPSPAGSLTLGSLLGSTCSDITDLLASEDFSILAGLVSDPEIASRELPPITGTVVLAAPTDAAFTSLLSTVGNNFTDNKKRVFEVLANHIALASSAEAETATALSGEELSFWTHTSGDAAGNVSIPSSLGDFADDPRVMKIFIQTVDGAALTTIDTSPSETIEAIKSKIQDQFGILMDKQHLVFAGKVLEDNRTLGDYIIPNLATILLVISQRAGNKSINFMMEAAVADTELMRQSITATAMNPTNSMITDVGQDELAKVVTAVACPEENQYAFAVDSVLLPKQFESEASPAPADSSPAVEPNPKPTPPSPVNASSAGGMASIGFAVLAAVAAAIMA